jgi:hypothetical protein
MILLIHNIIKLNYYIKLPVIYFKIYRMILQIFKITIFFILNKKSDLKHNYLKMKILNFKLN